MVSWRAPASGRTSVLAKAMPSHSHSRIRVTSRWPSLLFCLRKKTSKCAAMGIWLTQSMPCSTSCTPELAHQSSGHVRPEPGLGALESLRRRCRARPEARPKGRSSFSFCASNLGRHSNHLSTRLHSHDSHIAPGFFGGSIFVTLTLTSYFSTGASASSRTISAICHISCLHETAVAHWPGATSSRWAASCRLRRRRCPLSSSGMQGVRVTTAAMVSLTVMLC